MRQISLILTLLCFSFGFTQDQQTSSFSLQEAIDYALENNREAKNAAIEEAGIGVDIDGVSMSGADYQGETGNNTGGSKSSGGSKSGGFSSAERGASFHGAKGGLARYYRGGIASL